MNLRQPIQNLKSIMAKIQLFNTPTNKINQRNSTLYKVSKKSKLKSQLTIQLIISMRKFKTMRKLKLRKIQRSPKEIQWIDYSFLGNQVHNVKLYILTLRWIIPHSKFYYRDPIIPHQWNTNHLKLFWNSLKNFVPLICIPLNPTLLIISCLPHS